MMENERSTEEPFSAMGTYLLFTDMMLSACSAARPGGDLQFPSPAQLILNSVPGCLPLPVCSVIPLSWPRCNVSRERKLCEALNDWHGWHYCPQREDSAKINLFPQKASIFTQLHFPMRKSINFQQIPSMAVPGNLQSPLCSHWKG